jgi:hypothetical protein
MGKSESAEEEQQREEEEQGNNSRIGLFISVIPGNTLGFRLYRHGHRPTGWPQLNARWLFNGLSPAQLVETAHSLIHYGVLTRPKWPICVQHHFSPLGLYQVAHGQDLT